MLVAPPFVAPLVVVPPFVAPLVAVLTTDELERLVSVPGIVKLEGIGCMDSGRLGLTLLGMEVGLPAVEICVALVVKEEKVGKELEVVMGGVGFTCADT